jgi:hypothetical protein
MAPLYPKDDVTAYIVVEDSGGDLGRAFRETDIAEADHDTIVHNMISGEYRVVSGCVRGNRRLASTGLTIPTQRERGRQAVHRQVCDPGREAPPCAISATRARSGRPEEGILGEVVLLGSGALALNRRRVQFCTDSASVAPASVSRGRERVSVPLCSR